MPLKPLQDRVAVKRVKEEGQTASGIILVADEATDMGEVVAIGPGRQLDDGQWSNMGIAVGDIVLLGKKRGQEVNLKGEKLTVLREADVFAVVVP